MLNWKLFLQYNKLLMKRTISIITFLFICNILVAQCWLQVDANGNFNLGIKQDGTLWAWGYNYTGQLGDGTTVKKYSPIQIGTDTDWVKVSAGSSFSLAIKSNGTLWAWGENTYGQLGDGTTTNKLTPVQIGTATNWSKIIGSGYHCLAIKSDGSLWSWGWNNYGQLGIGNNTNKSIPTRVGTDNNWVTISSKAVSSAAIKSDGTLWSWGRNDYGQLGDGTNISKNSPIQIETSSIWNTVSLEETSMLAIKGDGTLWGCGNNFYGELGIGISGGGPYNLTQVGTDTNWQKVYGGASYAKAIKNDGSMWAWGANGTRVFGDTTISTSNVPLLISSESWSYIDTGIQHTINIKNDGTLWVCGQNTDGQLGTGSTTGNGLTYLTQINCPVGLGITQNSISKFTLFPNPANNFITIAGEGSDAIDAIEIFDVTGKKILTTNVTNINVDNLSNGIYLMQINANTLIERYKFIKQ